MEQALNPPLKCGGRMLRAAVTAPAAWRCWLGSGASSRSDVRARCSKSASLGGRAKKRRGVRGPRVELYRVSGARWFVGYD